ncbi:hypothetical protein C0992_011386, partial [Termitomyces sp. T32_za158]
RELVGATFAARWSKTQTLEQSLVPHEHYNYTRVLKACCENIVGYIPIPMVTAEGTLMMPTSRGRKERKNSARRDVALAERTVFAWSATATGDATGMNMISKGTAKALEAMQHEFPRMVVLALWEIIQIRSPWRLIGSRGGGRVLSLETKMSES